MRSEPAAGKESGTIELSYGRFSVSLSPDTTLALPPYPGALFRGGFGYALRQVVCVTKTYDCPPCALRDRCVYPYVFETPPPPDIGIMRKYTQAPHPFVLAPPWPGRTTVEPGERVVVGLTLFGKVLRHLPYFVYAFERLGATGLGPQRVRCRLRAVEALMDGARWTLYSADDSVLRAPDPFETWMRLALGNPACRETPSPVRRLTVQFLTPARLISQERLAHEVDFLLLVRSLLRRIGHLVSFHCGGDLSGVAFREWIERAAEVRTVAQELQWYDWERYSTRQQAHMKLGGVIGTVTYEGMIDPFLPLLRAGEVVHVGKGTSFGLGRYRVLEARPGGASR